MSNTRLTDDELLAKLRSKYERTIPGVCPQCGTPVTVEDHPGGYPLPWSCPKSVEALEQAKKAGAGSEELAPHLAHWESSRWQDWRRDGDRRVMDLIARFEALRSLAVTS